MSSQRPHKNLVVWKEAIELVMMVYRICELLPSEEKFGLVSQMKRASVSVPSNIAEGAARKSNKENIQFLYISSGSLSELDTQNTIIRKLNYIDEMTFAELDEKINKVSAILNGLIEKKKSLNLHSFITSFLNFFYV